MSAHRIGRMSTESAKRPVVAIVGSADSSREDELGLRDVEQAPAACEALGRELARQGVDIIVYSSKPCFIEHHVVRGYATSESATPGSIQVRLPLGSKGSRFAEASERSELFDHRPDASEDWEVSFYRSLVETDGVLLLGGGRSTYVTGLIALAFGVPVVAVASFGGYAARVWQALDRMRNDALPEEIAQMGGAWRDDLAGPLVASVVKQGQRRAAKEAAGRRDATRDARRAFASLLIASVLLLLALAAIPLSNAWEPGTERALGLLIGAPLLASIAGAIVRHSFDRGRDWFRTAVLGMAAGAIASLLFVAAQLVTTPDILQSTAAHRLLFFVVPVGFVAGLTFDDVYRKLRGEDVTRSDVLQQ
jgi:hypothetical protein